MRVLKSFAYRYVNGELSEPQFGRGGQGRLLRHNSPRRRNHRPGLGIPPGIVQCCGGPPGYLHLGSGDWHNGLRPGQHAPIGTPRCRARKSHPDLLPTPSRLQSARRGRSTRTSASSTATRSTTSTGQATTCYGHALKILADGSFDPTRTCSVTGRASAIGQLPNRACVMNPQVIFGPHRRRHHH